MFAVRFYLGGIAIKPGVVRQVVATPTVSRFHRDEESGLQGKPLSITANEAPYASGATIERQITGKDTIGGIQLQIIPQFDVENVYAGNLRDVISRDINEARGGILGRFISYENPIPNSTVELDVLKTPRELGLSENEVIHIKNTAHRQKSREKLIKDLFMEEPPVLTHAHFLELELYRRSDI
jgi:hypothetical protein